MNSFTKQILAVCIFLCEPRNDQVDGIPFQPSCQNGIKSWFHNCIKFIKYCSRYYWCCNHKGTPKKQYFITKIIDALKIFWILNFFKLLVLSLPLLTLWHIDKKIGLQSLRKKMKQESEWKRNMWWDHIQPSHQTRIKKAKRRK